MTVEPRSSYPSHVLHHAAVLLFHCYRIASLHLQIAVSYMYMCVFHSQGNWFSLQLQQTHDITSVGSSIRST